MTKKPTPGGTVQISGKPYTVIEGPKFAGGMYRIKVRRDADNGGYWANAPWHQRGCGPWKIVAPVISPDA
jgi:hypothetical protein